MCGIKYIQYSPQVGIYSDKHDEHWTEPDIGIYDLRLNNIVSGFISNIRLTFYHLRIHAQPMSMPISMSISMSIPMSMSLSLSVSVSVSCLCPLT
jgi:hypothetical protein